MCLNNKRPPKAAVTIKPYNIMAQNHSQNKKVYDAMRFSVKHECCEYESDKSVQWTAIMLCFIGFIAK